MDRNLDGVYFRVRRGLKWENICFSDLTRKEKDKVCEGRSAEWLKELAYIMAETLKDMGDKLDIVAETVKESEEEN